jgi:hypothetical protein
MISNDLPFLAKSIALKIKNDLTGRGGLDGAWDSIDSDIQEEILKTWEGIILENLDTFVNHNY